MSLRRAAGNLGYLFSALFPARGLIGFQPIGLSDEADRPSSSEIDWTMPLEQTDTARVHVGGRVFLNGEFDGPDVGASEKKSVSDDAPATLPIGPGLQECYAGQRVSTDWLFEDGKIAAEQQRYDATLDAWDREIDRLLEHQGPTPRITGNRGLGPSERDAEWIDSEGDRWRWNPNPGVWQNKINRTGVSTGWYSVPTEDGTTSPEYAPYREIVSADGHGSGKDVGQRAEESSGAYRPSCPTSPSVDDPESIDSACARFINGLLSGDLADALAASEVIYDRLVEWVNQVLDAVYPHASSAAGEASATDNHDRGPSAEERPAPKADSPGAGHPTLTSGDLADAAYAVRGFAEGHRCAVIPEEWNALADKLSAASEHQK